MVVAVCTLLAMPAHSWMYTTTHTLTSHFTHPPTHTARDPTLHTHSPPSLPSPPFSTHKIGPLLALMGVYKLEERPPFLCLVNVRSSVAFGIHMRGCLALCFPKNEVYIEVDAG